MLKPCKNKSGKAIKSERNSLSIDGYCVRFYDSINDINTVELSMLLPKHNLFLNTSYLQILESNPPEGMQFQYMVFCLKDEPVGFAQCQIEHFEADRAVSGQNGQNTNRTPGFFDTMAKYMKGFVASKVEFYTLLCGSLLLTGEHAYHFTSRVESSLHFKLIEEGLNKMVKHLGDKGLKISTILLKDFFEENRSPHLVKQSYNEFTIQPNMIMELKSEWKNFDDYLNALLSKYRTRTRRARKKLGALEIRELSADEVTSHKLEMHELYKSIADNSGFNVLNLNVNYLPAMKDGLGEDMMIFGIFEEGKMVGFYTAFLNHDELEAHFLGFKRELNRTNQIYLNILYNLVELGIEKQVHKIVFARTALEIKSSVGAKAVEMYCYFRHSNSFTNKFLNPLLSYLRPEAKLVPRHPFKELDI